MLRLLSENIVFKTYTKFWIGISIYVKFVHRFALLA